MPFFNTYHYTVYVPSNESVRALIDEKGLPTWEYISTCASDSATKGKAASSMRLLNNFLRYHFQDNSVYVDAVPFSMPAPGGGAYTEANFATAVVNNKTGRFYETTVTSADNNETLLVKDQLGNVAKVLKDGEEGKTWNVMSRDVKLTAKTNGHIATSSFAVLHSIDRALLNDGLFGYDGRFQRFAATGEFVDVMNVDGIEGAVTLKDGSKPYLVANFGHKTMKDKAGNEVLMRLAYLMQPIDASDSEYDEYTHEKFVLDAEGNKILITSEGFMAVEKKDADGKYYDYVTEPAEEEGYEYLLQVDNYGNVKNKVSREVTAAK